jgi:hypothetical protein
MKVNNTNNKQVFGMSHSVNTKGMAAAEKRVVRGCENLFKDAFNSDKLHTKISRKICEIETGKLRNEEGLFHIPFNPILDTRNFVFETLEIGKPQNVSRSMSADIPKDASDDILRAIVESATENAKAQPKPVGQGNTGFMGLAIKINSALKKLFTATRLEK